MELIIKRFDELTNVELYEVLKLRSQVFVVEQNCIYQDIDDRDQDAVHLFYRDEDGIQSYLRVMDKSEHNNKITIGRVVSRKRRSGLATALLKEGIKLAEESIHLLVDVHAASMSWLL